MNKALSTVALLSISLATVAMDISSIDSEDQLYHRLPKKNKQ